MTSLLLNDKGVTIVEVLISFVIIVIAVVGIYLGLMYADYQINRNYHERVAALYASGECEWQYFFVSTYREFDRFGSRDVALRSYRDMEHQDLTGIMQMSVSQVNYEMFEGRELRYRTVEIEITWEEPLLGERTMVIQEDFYQ